MTTAPAPYCMANDNVIMLLFIINITGMAYVILMNGASIIERVKCIFYYQRNTPSFNDRTHITRICNTFMYLQTLFYLSIITVTWIIDNNSNTTPHALLWIGILALFFAIVILLKGMAYSLVNHILFSKKEVDEWQNIYSFAIKMLGFILTPAVVARLFIPSISINSVNFYTLLTLVFYIYTIISSALKIIFAKKRNYFDILLYLCALEFLPIAMVWKFIQQLSEQLTIKI